MIRQSSDRPANVLTLIYLNMEGKTCFRSIPYDQKKGGYTQIDDWVIDPPAKNAKELGAAVETILRAFSFKPYEAVEGKISQAIKERDRQRAGFVNKDLAVALPSKNLREVALQELEKNGCYKRSPDPQSYKFAAEGEGAYRITGKYPGFVLSSIRNGEIWFMPLKLEDGLWQCLDPDTEPQN